MARTAAQACWRSARPGRMARRMLTFLADNRRWLGAGLLLTFSSAFGQTWFISLFAGEIRAAHGLSAGDWGLVYTLATLASAGLLFARGALADTMPFGRLAPAVALVFAASLVAFALAPNVWLLGLAVFGLRFCGLGMFSHIAMTAMGRWFNARRGRAVSIVVLGYSLAEVTLILPALALIEHIGWRPTLGIAAALVAVAVAPALAWLLARDRMAQSEAEAAAPTTGLGGRDWTRRDLLRHWLFWALIPFILTPGFIGTLLFFHQVHIAEVKGWTLAGMAPAYLVYASLTIGSALAAGWIADRFGPLALLPGVLVPMGLGVLLVGPIADVRLWYLAFGLTGLTQGTASALWGVLLPAVYGTRHLGSVRALVTTILIFSTAAGPWLSGVLIDRGIEFPRQSGPLGLWCLALGAAGLAIHRKLARET